MAKTGNLKTAELMDVLLCVASLARCSASGRAFNRGNELARIHNWDAAIEYYERALLGEPDNVEYQIAFRRALLRAQHFHLREARKHLVAEELEKAVEEFKLALHYGATNPYAQAQLRELRRHLEKREHERLPTP